jgi:hypothetical protein
MSWMSKKRASIALGAIWLFAASSPLHAVNLLQNPGFEATGGFLTGWTTIGTPFSQSSSAHSGAVAAVSGGSEIFQTLSLQIGQTYEFSLWAFSTSSTNTIRVQSVAVSPVSFLLRDGLTGTFQRVSTTFVATGTSASLRVLANALGGTTTIDDLCLDVVGGACGTAVPEPIGWWMAVVSLAVLGVCRRVSGG